MNYQQIYNQLIEQAKVRITNLETKRHHIIPECFFIKRKPIGEKGWIEGNPDDEDNLVNLTLREHFIALKLLAKIYGGRIVYPVFRMSNYGKYSSRTYEWHINGYVFK